MIVCTFFEKNIKYLMTDKTFSKYIRETEIDYFIINKKQYKILFNKIQRIGIRDVVYKWFKSYLKLKDREHIRRNFKC